MRKSKFFMNMMALLAVLVSVVFVSCGAFFENEQNGNITINLPPVSSQSRAISSDKISDLKNAKASYRVTVNGITREGTEGAFTFTLPVGAVAEITVECLNSSGNVIVRAKKTHTVKSGTNNVDINLSRDGDVVGTGGSNPPAPPAPPQPVTVRITFEAGYYIINTQPQTWKEMGMDARPPQAGEKNPGAAISEAMTLNGFAFKGWVLKDSYNPSATSYSDQPIITTYPNTASTLVGIWEENPPDTFTLSYSWGDGVAVAQGTLPSQAICTAGSPENIEITSNVIRTGYEFLGWNESQNAQTATYASGGTTQITISQDTTLYAVWRLITYTITYNAGNGTITVPGTNSFDINTTNISFGTVTLAGYTFSKWVYTDDQTDANPDAAALIAKAGNNRNISLTAKWTPITYTIKFNAGVGGSDSQADLQFTVEDTNKALPTANEVTFTPPQSKAFKHWATQADGDDEVTLSDIISGIKNGNASSYVTGNNEITIYAVWKDKPDLTSTPTVGSIIMKDGTLCDTTSVIGREADAIAVVYKVDTNARKVWAVGKDHSRNGLQWCLPSSNGLYTNFSALQCKPDAGTSTGNYTWKTGQNTDGCNNWQLLKEALGNNDDTSTLGNYPAWEYCNNYGSSFSGAFASGWYFPCIAELFDIYQNRNTVDASLQSINGTLFERKTYFSSSQYDVDSTSALMLPFSNGGVDYIGKSYESFYVCAIRAFSY